MRTLARVALALAPLACGAARAGVYDGNWVGQIPSSGPHCRSIAVMTITVSENNLSGVVHNRANVRAFTGTVDTDGNATFTVPQFHYSGTIKFSADHFDANWNSGDCQRHSLGDRAPDATQTAALLAERTQGQATYDDLTAKAAAGDRTVDFTVLRSAYPFTRQWDVFSGTSGPILEQAKVAAKGKDCGSALEKLDEILKLDFTIDAAHAVRGDCLAATGQEAASKIESNIADGLIHSLMDSGDGNTEATAYVVTTVREEMDVLANRHLVVKLRQTQVRGSNEHLYDVVQGTSVTDGSVVKTVYFDVSSFVNGRKSRMAAIDTLASTMP